MPPANDVGSLHLRYHERSDLSLPSREEDEIVELLQRNGVAADIRRSGLPLVTVATLKGGTEVRELLNLALIVVGTLMSKKVLEEIAKDLYGLIKKWIVEKRLETPDKGPFHTLLSLDVVVGGEPMKVSITYDDEVTFEIAMWRLREHLRGHPEAEGQLNKRGFIELTYPVGCNRGYVVMLGIIAAVVAAFSATQSRNLLARVPSLALALAGRVRHVEIVGAVVALVVTVPIWYLVAVRPCRKRKSFVARFNRLIEEANRVIVN